MAVDTVDMAVLAVNKISLIPTFLVHRDRLLCLSFLHGLKYSSSSRNRPLSTNILVSGELWTDLGRDVGHR
jgi:hypothetical protein